MSYEIGKLRHSELFFTLQTESNLLSFVSSHSFYWEFRKEQERVWGQNVLRTELHIRFMAWFQNILRTSVSFLPWRPCSSRSLSGPRPASCSSLTTTMSSSSTITGRPALPAKKCQKTPRSVWFVAPLSVSRAFAANSRVSVNVFWWVSKFVFVVSPETSNFRSNFKQNLFTCLTVSGSFFNLYLFVDSTPNIVAQLQASFSWSTPQSSSSSVDIVSACGVPFTSMPTERRTAIYGTTHHTHSYKYHIILYSLLLLSES